jgi:hypothetical protein
MAMYLPAITRSSAVVAAVPPAAGLGAAELRGGVLAGAVVWAGVALLAQPAASRTVPSSTVPAVTRLVTAACPCMSVTLPPDKEHVQDREMVQSVNDKFLDALVRLRDRRR